MLHDQLLLRPQGVDLREQGRSPPLSPPQEVRRDINCTHGKKGATQSLSLRHPLTPRPQCAVDSLLLNLGQVLLVAALSVVKMTSKQFILSDINT